MGGDRADGSNVARAEARHGGAPVAAGRARARAGALGVHGTEDNDNVGRTEVTKLAYILAASHSGSTLLAMLLGAHRETCTVGELKAAEAR